MINGLYTILLLIGSNIFMTLAWYGHLKLQQMNISNSWPLWLVIVFSWGIAFFEYSLQVPANKLGFVGNGGPYSLVQLKVVHVPGGTLALESCCCLPLFGGSRLFRVLEMKKRKDCFAVLSV